MRKPNKSSERQSKMKKIVTKSEMVEIIRSSVKGTSMVSVDLDSPQDKIMLKTGNHFIGQGIIKRETLTGVIGYDYGKAVNRLAVKEGQSERQAKPHPWGDMDENSLFRVKRDNGNLYLSMKVESVKVHGFLNNEGKEVDSDAIRCFIPVKKKSSTQEGLEGEVIARDYSMENIRAIRMKGDEYIIMEAPEVKAVKEMIREGELVMA